MMSMPGMQRFAAVQPPPNLDSQERMKSNNACRGRVFVSLAAATLILLSSKPGEGGTEAFHFDPSRVPVRTLFEYRKSNLDGSNAANILVYVRDETHVESFKQWHDPTRATLVVAQMDWSRFSVGAFEAFDLACGQAAQSRATLEVEADKFRVSFMPAPVPLTHTLWHSYDFDFTSLSLTIPMLRDSPRAFTFWRSDILFEPELKFAEIGEVRLEYQAEEVRQGRRSRRFSIGGPGLGHAVGTWWSDALTGLLVEFAIPIPDEPGYDSVRMVLLETSHLNIAEWESYKKSVIC
jgi:hypothetical protein